MIDVFIRFQVEPCEIHKRQANVRDVEEIAFTGHIDHCVIHPPIRGVLEILLFDSELYPWSLWKRDTTVRSVIGKARIVQLKMAGDVCALVTDP